MSISEEDDATPARRGQVARGPCAPLCGHVACRIHDVQAGRGHGSPEKKAGIGSDPQGHALSGSSLLVPRAMEPIMYLFWNSIIAVLPGAVKKKWQS